MNKKAKEHILKIKPVIEINLFLLCHIIHS